MFKSWINENQPTENCSILVSTKRNNELSSFPLYQLLSQSLNFILWVSSQGSLWISCKNVLLPNSLPNEKAMKSHASLNKKVQRPKSWSSNRTKKLLHRSWWKKALEKSKLSVTCKRTWGDETKWSCFLPK